MTNFDTNKEQLEHVLQNLVNRQNKLQQDINELESELTIKKNELSHLLHQQQMSDLHFSPRKRENSNDVFVHKIQDDILILNDKISAGKIELLEEEKNILYLNNLYYSLFSSSYVMEDKEAILEQDKILEMRERERQRIAMDLHDSVVQDLVYLTHQTELVQKYIQKDMNGVILELADMKKNIKLIIEQIREKIYNLRPMSFDDLGWDITFDRLQEELSQNCDLQIQFDIEKPEKWSQYKMVALYRIIRESCINAKKHAQAKLLQVKLIMEDNDILISIIDDGIGIKEDEINKKNHFGMDDIKENVLLLSGQMKIISKENQGTKITIRIPYVREDNIKND